jgi:hypothetical protein
LFVEPGDINWENLRVEGADAWLRFASFLLIVVGVSLISFAAMI